MSETKQVITNPYVILAETNGEELETWMYFIKKNGNEKALNYLQAQLEKIDMYVLDDLSAFELDLEHPVSEQTAKEMTKIEVNSYQFHRKFDGKLQYINIKMKKKDNNERRLERLHDSLGMGRIEDFIDQEDVSDSEDESEQGEGESSSNEEELVPMPSPSPKKSTTPSEAKTSQTPSETTTKTSSTTVNVDSTTVSLSD